MQRRSPLPTFSRALPALALVAGGCADFPEPARHRTTEPMQTSSPSPSTSPSTSPRGARRAKSEHPALAGRLAGPRRPGDAGPSRGPAPARNPSPEDGELALALALTTGGALALVDARSGAPLAEAPLGGRALDLAWDPFFARVLAFVLDEEEQSGTLVGASVAASPPSLGDPEARSWLDGVARVLPTPFGPVLFEESYGTRWRLLAETGKPTASSPSPLPSSAWALAGPAELEDGAASFALAGVGRTLEETPARWTAEASEAGLTPPVETLLGAAAGSSPVRGARGSGCDWVAAFEGDALALRCVDEAGKTTLSAAIHGLGEESRVEGAASLASGEALALLLGPEARVLVARQAGASLVHAVLSLGAEVDEAPALSRLLAPVGPSRLLAATKSGVVAVDVTLPPGSVELAIDAAFEGSSLRGPLDAAPRELP